MGFIDVDAIAVALGGATFTADQEAQLQYYIDFVCSYIESEIGMSFSIHEDAVLRYQSDSYGQIELDEYPVTAVGDILDYRGYPALGSRWTGMQVIDGLRPLTAYDVTLTYGQDGDVPLDLAGVATEAVKRAYDNGGSGSGALAEKTVGDTTEKYANPLDAALAFTATDTQILENYGMNEGTTYRLSTPLQSPRLYRNDWPFDDGWC